MRPCVRKKCIWYRRDIIYGKGYTAAREKFRKILRGLDVLHDQKKMNVILLSHVDIRTFNDPEREPYDRYQLKLHNKTASIIREWVDFNFCEPSGSYCERGEGLQRADKGTCHG